MTTSPPALPSPPAAAPSRRRVVVVLGGVVLGAAALLRTIDTLPATLRDEPRSVRTYATVEALERDTRTQLVLPFYFPDTLAWPPADIAWAGGDGRPTRVTIADRKTGAPRLVVAQCLDGECDLAHRLLPTGRTLEHERVDIGGGSGVVVRRQLPAIGLVSDLEWREYGRRFTIRIYGDDSQLMRIARSMRRGHP